jgi:prolactin regulatory element-binding protein
MSAVTLHTTNFPLYTVNVLDKNHFVVAGGGGSAKTGVPNALVWCSAVIYFYFLGRFFA